MSNLKIIIFGQHILNTLGQIRSFGEAGHLVYVVWLDHLPHSPKGCRYIKAFVSVNTFEEGLDYIISHFKEEGYKHFISTDSDAVVSLLDRHYDELKNYFYFFNAGEQGRLSQFMPKKKQCEIAEKYGIRVPKTELVHWGEMPQEVRFPVFTKAPDCFGVTWKEDAHICKTEDDLRQLYNKGHHDGDLLLQEFIERENEVAVEGISLNGGDCLKSS